MVFSWIREDKEEFFTGDYDAEGEKIYEIPEGIELNSYSELAELQELEKPIILSFEYSSLQVSNCQSQVERICFFVF